MVKEDYVNFELAKLLKEKGFDESVNRFYEISTGQPLLVRSEYCRNSYTIDYAAPTLQMAMKWLMEVHGIYIQCFRLPAAVKTDDNSSEWKPWYFEYTLLKPINEIDLDCKPDNFNEFKTYEEAVENALKYCLENLIH